MGSRDHEEPEMKVTASQTKPPASWVGARFEPGTTNPLPDVIDFASLTEPVVGGIVQSLCVCAVLTLTLTVQQYRCFSTVGGRW